MRMPSSWYRLLQLETHRSTSTPSTHRLSLLARGDASAEACNRDRAAETVGSCFASAVWREMRLAQNASCCSSKLQSVLAEVVWILRGGASFWRPSTGLLCLLAFASDLAMDPPVGRQLLCSSKSHLMVILGNEICCWHFVKMRLSFDVGLDICHCCPLHMAECHAHTHTS